jgi:lysophospholipase L1-like esterase
MDLSTILWLWVALAATVGLGLLVLVGILSARGVRPRVSYHTWYFVHLYVYIALALCSPINSRWGRLRHPPSEPRGLGPDVQQRCCTARTGPYGTNPPNGTNRRLPHEPGRTAATISLTAGVGGFRARRLVLTWFVAIAFVAATADPVGPALAAGAPRPSRAVAAHPPAGRSARPKLGWEVAWGSAMAWGFGIASDATVRELVTPGVGGEAVRVRISNAFGDRPLVIGAATVGVSLGAASVMPGTLRPLSFAGRLGVTVPVGHYAYSDPVAFKVSAGETLAVSLWENGTDLVSVHPCCSGMEPVSYFTPNGGGNRTASPTGQGLTVSSPWPRWVDAVDVLRSGPGSIVVLGDSITDGFNTTTNWVRVLQERVDKLPPSEQRAVVNEGITANALTSYVPTDSETGGGPSGLSRLPADALDQAGVSEVVVFLGTNDLWFGDTTNQLVAGYRQAIDEVRKAGLRIVGVTLLPRSPGRWPWSPAKQEELEQVDRWIRTSHAFDGVIDLARAVADVYNGACEPWVMFPPYDSGDHLHPNAAGQVAMANAVDPAVLGLPPLPAARALVAATPTRGCLGAT